MKKAQIWTVDFILGVSMFVLLLVTGLSLFLSINTDTNFEDATREAIYVSNILMSEGSPSNWNSSTVISPGLLSDGVLNNTKLEYFSEFNYDELKSFFALRNDFSFFFRDDTGFINTGSCSYGYDFPNDNCDPLFDELDYENLIVINRFVAVNSSIKNLVLYVWT